MKKTIIILLAIIGLTACNEKMTITPQDGEQLVGVSASVTDIYMKQEVIISRTEPFYGGAPTMISDATVFVVDGADTIWYEESEKPGYYLSVNEFAGQVDHTYHLSIDFSDENGSHHFFADSKMNENVEKIDTITVKPWVFSDLELKDYLGVYPRFKLTSDPNTCYMARVRINNNLVGGDTLTKCEIFENLGFAGLEVNSPIWIEYLGEMPIYGLNQKDSLEVVHRGDTVTLDLWTIPEFYAGYISDIAMSTGTNPMMGTPSNVRTNIYPEGQAVGAFYAASLRQYSVIY